MCVKIFPEIFETFPSRTWSSDFGKNVYKRWVSKCIRFVQQYLTFKNKTTTIQEPTMAAEYVTLLFQLI